MGIDWGDLGKNVFSGVHSAGKVLASSFGGGALIAPVESLENRGGLLQPWAGGTAPLQAVTITNPDAFIIVRQSGAIDQPMTGVASVVVTGGKKLDSDGRFSFVYDSPQRVDVTTKAGQKASGTDVRQILFQGGVESSPTNVKGDVMNYDDEIDTFEIAKNFYVHGTDVLGASIAPQPRAGFVVRRTARGRTFTALATAPKKGDLKASVKNAVDVGRRAQQVAARIHTTLSHLPTTVKGVTPARQVRRMATVAQLKTMASQLAKAGSDLIAKGNKLASGAAKSDAKVRAGTLAVQAKQFGMGSRAGRKLAVRAPGAAHLAATRMATAAARPGATTAARTALPMAARTTALGAYEVEIVGEANDILGEQLMQDAQILGAELSQIHYEVLGDAAEDAAQNAANQAMLDAAGPAYGDPNATSAPTGDTSYSTPTTSEPLPGPEQNYGLPPAPTEAPPLVDGTYTKGTDPATDQNVYDTTRMPLTGIVPYDGSKGLPRDRMGSFNRYYGPGAGSPNGGSGFYWAGAPDNWVIRLKDSLTTSGTDAPNTGSYHDGQDVPVDDMLAAIQGKMAIAKGYVSPYMGGGGTMSGPMIVSNGGGDASGLAATFGPLVGAPGDWTQGLRFDMGTKQWFWFADQAPDWATVAQRMERLHQAQVDYQTALTAAKTDYLAQQVQDKLDAQQSREIARQQAQDDANMASAQQQLDVQQAQMEQQYAQMEQQMEAQQADLDAREQSAMLSYFEQHPEEMFAPADEGGGYSDEDFAEGGQFEGGVDWGEGGGGDEGFAEAEEMFSEGDF